MPAAKEAPALLVVAVGLRSSSGEAATDGSGGLPGMGPSVGMSSSSSYVLGPGAAAGEDDGEVVVVGAAAAGPWAVAGPGAFAGAAVAGAGAGALAGPETAEVAGELAGVGTVVGDFAGEWIGAVSSVLALGPGAGASAAAAKPAAATKRTTRAAARYIFQRNRSCRIRDRGSVNGAMWWKKPGKEALIYREGRGMGPHPGGRKRAEVAGGAATCRARPVASRFKRNRVSTWGQRRQRRPHYPPGWDPAGLDGAQQGPSCFSIRDEPQWVGTNLQKYGLGLYWVLHMDHILLYVSVAWLYMASF